MNLLLLAASKAGAEPHWYLDPHGWGLVFWTGIVFALVILLLYKLAFGPLLEALDRREEAITGSIRSAEETKLEADRLRERYEERLEKARQEAQAIITEGEQDKKRIVADARDKAIKEAGDVRTRADRDIGLAKNKALAEVKMQACAIGMAIAEKVIAAEIDPAKHKAVVDEVIAGFERGEVRLR